MYVLIQIIVLLFWPEIVNFDTKQYSIEQNYKNKVQMLKVWGLTVWETC